MKRVREGKLLPQGCTARKWLQCQTNHSIAPKPLLASKAAALNSQPLQHPCPSSFSSLLPVVCCCAAYNLESGLLKLGVLESYRGFLSNISTPVHTLSLINSSEIWFLLPYPDHSVTKRPQSHLKSQKMGAEGALETV